MKLLTTLLFSFLCQLTYSQSVIPVYQDIWNGGVKCVGISTGQGGGNETLDLSIPASSTIKKIFLFNYTVKHPDSSLLFVNGNNIDLNEQNLVTSVIHIAPFASPMKIYMYDVTTLLPTIGLSNTIVNIGTPCVSDINCGVWTATFVILYDDPLLPTVSLSLSIPNKTLGGFEIYNIVDLNPINTNYPVGLSVIMDRACNNTTDGSKVHVEGNFLGIIGGNDNGSSYACPGSQGCFQYENQSLIALLDDNIDLNFDGTDALGDISTIVPNNSTTLDITLEHNNSIGNIGNRNMHILFPLAYITSCDTFSTSTISDTSVCNGEQIQLSATGGQSYNWYPSTGLSCTNCPNPILTGDSSRIYTVQIWNTDSCSVIRPVHISVHPKIYLDSLSITPSDCGTSNGNIEVYCIYDSLSTPEYSINSNIPQNINTFNFLSSGNYQLEVGDQNGCIFVDTLIVVPEINQTSASISVDPTFGDVPLPVSVTNNSVNATNYEWYLNGIYQGNTLTDFTCDTSGIYTIELIAWQFDPSCADSALVTVIAFQNLIVPTAFTPNNDLINDKWEILALDEQYPKNVVQIFNRWGNQIYQSKEGKYSENPWDGTYKGELMPVGSYYFIISLNDDPSEDLKGNVSIITR